MFVPRHIDPSSASLGYNNEGRGKLLGWIGIPDQHEGSCPYRKNQQKSCACRIGLWQENVSRKKKKKKRLDGAKQGGTRKRVTRTKVKKPAPKRKSK